MNRVGRKERIWLLSAILITLIFSSVPNWVGYASETSSLSYRGIFFDSQDYAVHLSAIRAGMQGEWGYQFRFTTEEHKVGYSRIFYIALGEINRPFDMAPAVLYEIARWLFGALSLFAIYELAARIFEKPTQRQTAFLIGVFGSGLGWLQLLTGWTSGPVTPIDFWFIDPYVFFGLALFPHFSLVTAMLCLSLASFLDFLRTGSWMKIVWIVLFSTLVLFTNPIAYVTVDTAMTAAVIVHAILYKNNILKNIIALAMLASAQLPITVYNYLLLAKDPIWSQLTTQNQTLSPPPIYYAWGFGLLWLFALIGLLGAIKQRHVGLIGSAAWIFIGLLLAYAPVYIQRRFLHAVTVPLGIMATQGWISISGAVSKQWSFATRRMNFLSLLFVFILSVSSMALGLGRSMHIHQQPEEFFYSSSLDHALAWLQDNSTPNEFVLCAAPTGLLVGQKTDLRVYIGHEMATLDYEKKLPQVEAFFKGQAGPGWLEVTQAAWVLFGPYEQALAGMNTFTLLNYRVVYRQGGITIWRVDQ